MIEDKKKTGWEDEEEIGQKKVRFMRWERANIWKEGNDEEEDRKERRDSERMSGRLDREKESMRRWERKGRKEEDSTGRKWEENKSDGEKRRNRRGERNTVQDSNVQGITIVLYNMLKNFDNVKEKRFAKRSKDSVEIKKTERKFGRRSN
jgi:hypothetical protein